VSMKQFSISQQQGIYALLITWFLLVAFAITGYNPLWLQWFVGAPFMLVVPGALVLVLLRLPKLGFAARAVLAVGFSVLILMLLGLFGNTVLPWFGVDRPLDAIPMAWLFSVLFLTLFALTWWQVRGVRVTMPRFVIADTARDAGFIVAPVAFVFLAVFGALRQNLGEGNGITMFMLVAIGVYSLFLMRAAPRLGAHVVPIAVFCIGLALLLMTSLRGWYVSGHDIQREFFVFQLAQDAGHWSVAVYRDAYNACLSITILPTLLANILHIPSPYVYKVLYQLVFAVSGVIVYLFARRWMSVQLAFLGSFFYLSFPTFFQDMPFLVRQEIAFLFLALLVYTLFLDTAPLKLRRVLFVLFGGGIVLSHYSTTYTVLIVLALTVVLSSLVLHLVRIERVRALCAHTALVLPGDSVDGEVVPRRITVKMVLVLMLLSALWTSVLTDTDGHLKSVATEVVAALRGDVSGETHSVDVLSIFSFGRVEAETTLEDYLRDAVEPRRAAAPSEYYATTTYASFPHVTLDTFELPVTPVGAWSIGPIVFTDAATFFGQLIAKVVQIAIIVGLVYVVFRRRFAEQVDLEHALLAGSSVAFVAMCIGLPLLSKEYGVFRALQQSLIVLAPFSVLGMLVVGWWFGGLAERWTRLVSGGALAAGDRMRYAYGTAMVLGTLFFLYSSGFVTQLVGGNLPAVHLNSVGDDYKHYVTESSEHQAIQWLLYERERVRAEEGVYPLIQSDRFGAKKLRAYMAGPVGGDVYPGLVHKSAYVFVTPAIQYSGTAFVVHDGTTIKYAYPLDFLYQEKELLYTNGDVLIFR